MQIIFESGETFWYNHSERVSPDFFGRTDARNFRSLTEGDETLAKKTMDVIRSAEAAADEKVRDARKQADRIVDEATQEAAGMKEQAEKEAAASLAKVRSQAAEAAKKESQKAKEGSMKEAQALKVLASEKKDEAVQMVIDEIVG